LPFLRIFAVKFGHFAIYDGFSDRKLVAFAFFAQKQVSKLAIVDTFDREK